MKRNIRLATLVISLLIIVLSAGYFYSLLGDAGSTEISGMIAAISETPTITPTETLFPSSTPTATEIVLSPTPSESATSMVEIGIPVTGSTETTAATSTPEPTLTQVPTEAETPVILPTVSEVPTEVQTEVATEAATDTPVETDVSTGEVITVSTDSLGGVP